jgi:hypothetical protein
MVVIPRRGKGRPSAAGAAAYREQVEEFCRQIEQIRGNPRFRGQRPRMVLHPRGARRDQG